MNNIPEVKVGVVAVSRDCFPESLSVNRRKALMDAYTKKYGTEVVMKGALWQRSVACRKDGKSDERDDTF